MRFRIVFVLALTLLLLTVPAQAQEWRQSVEVLMTVQYDEPLGVFADSLDHFLAQNPNTQVRRTPQDPVSMPFTDLREKLYNDGVEVGSVTHVLIRYRFDLDRRSRLIETIEDVNFILRENENKVDLGLIYVDFRDSVIGEFLRTRGMRGSINLHSMTSFRKILSFAYTNRAPNRIITEIGGHPRRVEKPFSPREEMIVHFLTGQSDMRPESYVLTSPAVESVPTANP